MSLSDVIALVAHDGPSHVALGRHEAVRVPWRLQPVAVNVSIDAEA